MSRPGEPGAAARPGAGKLRQAIDEARAAEPGGEVETQGRFRVRRRWAGREGPGLYAKVTDKDGGHEWKWFASLIEVVAATRGDTGEQWGRLLALHDRDGTRHEWAMPMAMLAGDGAAYRERLLSLGAEIAPGNFGRNSLHEYITLWRPAKVLLCVDRVGWHLDSRHFVLPDRTYSAPAEEETAILQTAGPPPLYEVKGERGAWEEEVAKPAIGNSRLAFVICAALAAPLLRQLDEESGGFHLAGQSSSGKTTALHVAAAVWGSKVHSWRTTDNAAESMAVGASDALLALDEMGQADGRTVDALAYMFSNESGKNRLGRYATAQQTLAWRTLFLSSGELGLAAKLHESGRRSRAGQSVRVVEIPADAGAGQRLFEVVPFPATNADEFARNLRRAAAEHRGHAGRAFIEKLVGDRSAIVERVRTLRGAFVEKHMPAGCDGQVSRVVGRFGLVAAAGGVASELHILPWEAGEASRAAERCLAAWLDLRGGVGPGEVREGLRQVRLFLENHGSSRFETLGATQDRPIVNRAGFRTRQGVGDDDGWEYYVFPETWTQEVCAGFDAKLIARQMIERGWMEPGEGRNLAKRKRVTGHGNPRLYTIGPSFLSEDDSQ